MTDADLDRVLRSADPAAARPAPAPGPLPHRPPVVAPPRRSAWLPAAAAAAAVVAVVGAAVAVLPAWDRGGVQAGAPGGAAPSAPGGPAATSGPPKPDRPHTASAGADLDRARRLLGTLQAAVPDRYDLPAGQLPIGPDGSTLPAAGFQAVRDEGPYAGYAGYEYHADTVVRDGRGTGVVSARVWTGVPDRSPCAVAELVSWHEGTCTAVTTVAGPVAVLRGGGDADPRETQWAVHRRADGTVVLVGQGPGVLNGAVPRLTGPVWTPAELAALATAPAFAAG